MNQLYHRVNKLGTGLLALLVAAVAVWLTPYISVLGQSHQAVLPFAVLMILAAMLHPRLRHFLVVSLCFGVAFFAIQDTGRLQTIPLPPLIRYDFIDTIRHCVLVAIACLAGLAGAGETFDPSAVWVRRCYFGAVSLYFMGLGLFDYAQHTSWRSLILIFTGIAAMIGCLCAQFLVGAMEEQDNDLEGSDERLQLKLENTHRAALQAKEWRDTLLSALEERENSAPPHISH